MTRYEKFLESHPEEHPDPPYSVWLGWKFVEFLTTLGLKYNQPNYWCGGRKKPLCGEWYCQRDAFNTWLGVDR